MIGIRVKLILLFSQTFGRSATVCTCASRTQSTSGSHAACTRLSNMPPSIRSDAPGDSLAMRELHNHFGFYLRFEALASGVQPFFLCCFDLHVLFFSLYFHLGYAKLAKTVVLVLLVIYCKIIINFGILVILQRVTIEEQFLSDTSRLRFFRFCRCHDYNISRNYIKRVIKQTR